MVHSEISLLPTFVEKEKLHWEGSGNVWGGGVWGLFGGCLGPGGGGAWAAANSTTKRELQTGRRHSTFK